MRGFLASSIGVTCAAALALPLTPPAVAAAARPAPGAEAATTVARAAEPGVPGSTQSLPLVPLDGDRTSGPTAEQGLPRRDVRRFSLVGVVWDNPDTELHGRVQVRTRDAATGTWSGWQDVETHNHEHAPDPGTDEEASGRVHGATAPLWVGDSDGVEVRASAEPQATGGDGADRPAGALPPGMRLELVDPGGESGGVREADRHTAPLHADTPDSANAGQLTDQQRAGPYIGPRPRIVTRRGWGANEKLREKKVGYTKKVKVAFVHHTGTGNKHWCKQAPSVIRGIYRYHVKSMGWRDVGYNFFVDRCGNIYEGRAGGVAKPVLGAHTLGFNTNSMGIAVLGTFESKKPSGAAVKAISRLTAWKLGLYGVNPRGKTYLKSGGGNLYRKGKKVRLNVISGHLDSFDTACPGRQLYRKLGSARATAARYQGR
ncbi:peptidoglycan recognition protein [Streptomyces sp. DG2A-72]|uniref:peptidoglycan recognition protein family protein n=1 Tax=Streptomyces sp. DG2A-72 TaxID=3051386 RepID=UPI00265C2949|nr:peptidoglycan recognition protein [Streptomyces sp. DG2A-72]MDO0933663.1 peptidoglycan recognition protein [Streptomyces sp. DG2A-72]